MKVVGIKELKDKLSYYLRYVRAGEAILIRDRDNVIAEIRPHDKTIEKLPNLVRELLEKNMLKRSTADKSIFKRPSPIKLPAGSTLEALDFLRRDPWESS